MITDTCICHLHSLLRALNGIEADMQKVTGLNLNEAMALCLLNGSEGDLMAGEIAEELGLTRSNTSKVIAVLEKEALIRRHVCPQDYRCQKFCITKKGKDKLEETKSKLSLPDELKE